MKYVPPIGAAAGAAYVDAAPASGVEGSPVPAAAIEHPMREIEAVITGAGLVPATGDLTQLRQAIAKMIQAGQRAVVISNATFAGAVTGTGKAVYWDSTNSRFDLALADTTAKQNCVGFADVPNGNVYAFGDAVLFTGLTPGARYYLDGTTAGAITTTAPTNAVFVGIARNATELFVDVDAVPAASGDPSALYKVDAYSPCLVKTAAGAVAIRAGTRVTLASGAAFSFAAQTAVSMPSHAAGNDYSVWVKPDGSAVAVLDTFAARASAPVAGARKIGGYHYGLVAPGTTVASGGFSTGTIDGSGGSMAWTQALVDAIAGINAYSIWDLQWRVKGEQYGMTYCPLKQAWCGIYMMSDSPHLYGASAYNTNIASGTVLPFVPPEWGGNGTLKYTALNAFNAHELVSARGLRLPTYDEYMGFAFGVTEGQSLGGASSTVPATARAAGYTSMIGVEQATGHQWVFGGPIISVGGSAYSGNGRGSWLGSSGEVLLGGDRDNAANSGSRAAHFGNALSDSHWACSVRAAGDHLNLAVAAR